MYDWANSAFATTVIAALFPPFYRSLVLAAGLPEKNATAYWGYTTAVVLLLMAVLSPLLGAIGDYTGGKKRYVAFFIAVGVTATALLATIGEGEWLKGSVICAVAAMGFAGSILFYESFLPHIATRGDIDQVSARGYATGYVGGGILLVVNVLWVWHPDWFGMPDQAFAVRASFVSVAVWWGLFSIPFFRRVPEPPVARTEGPRRPLVGVGFARLVSTFREIRRYRQLIIFLVAFWVYSDGIGTMMRMATAYGDEIGIGLVDMVLALIITQFVGIPTTIGFGRLARRVSAKPTIMLTLAVFTVIAIGAYFMKTALHFYLLAGSFGVIQGGCAALSRSLFGSMVPKHKTAEFFGFFSASAKFAGILGPMIFGIVGQATGGSRMSIIALVVFFLVGMAVLSRVDVEEGRRVAGGMPRK
jgi:UMF1 family MFS transporter